MTTFIMLTVVGLICTVAAIAGVVIYLKRRGVLRAAADAASNAAKAAVTADVDKLTK